MAIEFLLAISRFPAVINWKKVEPAAAVVAAASSYLRVLGKLVS